MMIEVIKLSQGGIKYFQLFLLGFSSVLLMINGLLTWLEPTKNMIMVASISLAGLVVFNLVYSKVYDITVKDNTFIIENLYKYLELGFENFSTIKKIPLFPFLYKVVFKGKSYCFIGTFSLALKEFTANTDEALGAITAQLRKAKTK